MLRDQLVFLTVWVGYYSAMNYKHACWRPITTVTTCALWKEAAARRSRNNQRLSHIIATQ